jgi:FkbM family methyltransferase
MINKNITNVLIDIFRNPDKHVPESKKFKNLSKMILDISDNLFLNNQEGTFIIDKDNSFVDIKFPYKELGKISSKNFFNLNELIFSSFYLFSNNKYKNFADMGACLGFHGIIFSKYKKNSVSFFEPDPNTFQLLLNYIKLNKIHNYKAINKAIYNKDGEILFNRLDENNTGSHIVGSKDKIYGPISTFKVETICFNTILQYSDYDLIKIDIEGAELDIFQNLEIRDIKKFPDIYLEIHNKKSAEIIFDKIKNQSNLNIFSQNLGWKKITTFKDMPTHYSHGSVFISKNDNMGWN